MTVEDIGKVDLYKIIKQHFLEIIWFLGEKLPEQIFVLKHILMKRIH